MKVTVEELSSVRRKVSVEIPAAEVDKLLNQIYRRIGRSARLKGFRPGKAPRKILERYYGDRAAAEAAEQLVGHNYAPALQETGLEPVAQPDFDFEAPQAGRDFTFHILLDVRPEFELDPSSYKGITLKEPKLEVTDEIIDQRLQELRERQAVTVPLEEERPAAPGDVVVVDYTSFVGEEPVQGGAADNVEIELGAGKVPEEIDVALVKCKPGDMVETTVTYGQDDAPSPELAGKEVRFKFLVKQLKKKVLPELDDDFARSVSPEFDSLKTLKERIAKELEDAYQQERDAALRTQILDAIRDLGEFELPASLVEEETRRMVDSVKQRLRQQGVDLQAADLDEARMAEDFRPAAERKVRAGIVLGKIADQEKVEVQPEDEQAHFEKMAERTGQPASALKEIYNKNNMMSSLRAQLLEEKTLQAIKADAKIELVDPAELAAEIEQKGQDSR